MQRVGAAIIRDRVIARGIARDRRPARAVLTQVECPRRCQLAESIVAPARRERLAVDLEREIGPDRVVGTQLHEKRALVDARKDVAVRERGDILARVDRAQIVRSRGELKARRRADRDLSTQAVRFSAQLVLSVIDAPHP